MNRLQARLAKALTDLAFWSAVLFVVAVVSIIVLSFIYLNWRTDFDDEFLKGVLAGIVGVILGGLAAIALTILLVDRYHRRRRADQWRSVGREVATEIVRSLESWVISDLSDIHTDYGKTVRDIINDARAVDWFDMEAQVGRKSRELFKTAVEWLADPNEDDICVEDLAMVRIHSNGGTRALEIQRFLDEISSAGFDDPELILQMRRLRASWVNLRTMLRLWDIDMVMTDRRNPPPTSYQLIIDEAKEPTSFVLMICMRQACKVSQLLRTKIS